MTTQLRVVKGGIFKTIQGEGTRTGEVSVFLRLAGCDLRCHIAGGKFWHCDTPNSLPDYNPKLRVFTSTPTKHAEVMDCIDIAERIADFRCNELVVTGGEPMLQVAGLKHLVELLPSVKQAGGTRITVETNCRHFDEQFARHVYQPSLSPKIQSAMEQGGWTSSVEWECVKGWASYAAFCPPQLKIVCSTVEEYEYARRLFYMYRELFEGGRFYVQLADAPHTQRREIIEAVIADSGLCRLGVQQHKVLDIP